MKDLFQKLEGQAGGETDPATGDGQPLADYLELWRASAHNKLPQPPNRERQWTALRQKMHMTTESGAMGLSWSNPVLWGWTLTASALIFLAGLWWSTSHPRVYHQYKTAAGERKNLILPDGSKVVLNSGSNLRLARGFGEENRNLSLLGEAFFSVIKGGHPLVVETGTAQVQVIGTRFNVKSREGQWETGVVEGFVAVIQERDGQVRRVHLEAGQILRAADGLLPLRAAPLKYSNYPAWLHGDLHFERAPLYQVEREIERQYGIEIVLSDPGLGILEVNGTFKGDKVDKVIANLCTLMGRSFRREGETYVIE